VEIPNNSILFVVAGARRWRPVTNSVYQFRFDEGGRHVGVCGCSMLPILAAKTEIPDLRGEV